MIDIKTIIPNDPILIALSLFVFSVSLYSIYIYLNKDSKEEGINYSYLLYSVIPSILITILVNYLFCRYKSSNNDLLKGDYWSE